MVKTAAPSLSDDRLQQEMLEARARGLRRRGSQPFAVRAAYEPEYQHLEVELSNGFWFAFPPSLFSDLGKATPEQLSEIEIDPSGYSLHWAGLDADYDIGGLVQMALGAKKWLSISELGRLGGQSTSDAKRAAAAANGLKGGRPRSEPKSASKSGAKKTGKVGAFKVAKADNKKAVRRHKHTAKR